MESAERVILTAQCMWAMPKMQSQQQNRPVRDRKRRTQQASRLGRCDVCASTVPPHAPGCDIVEANRRKAAPAARPKIGRRLGHLFSTPGLQLCPYRKKGLLPLALSRANARVGGGIVVQPRAHLTEGRYRLKAGIAAPQRRVRPGLHRL